MRKRIIRNRKARYGFMTVLLTVLLITAIVLCNALVKTLVTRYSWYVNLNAKPNYSVTENCFTLLGTLLDGKDASVRIKFCDTEKNLKASATSVYVYENALAMAERFPNQIAVECHNIWLNPASVRDYTKTFNPATGEYVDIALNSSCVIIESGSYYRVYDLSEFFVFAEGDTSKLWAYNGEKKLAAGILHAIEPNAPTVCFTNNHGEIFYDYELMFLLDDAGYNIRHIDLFTEKIPEECTLLISYNPNTDLTVADGVATSSETDALNAFLQTSGNTYLVFVENGTPKLPNLEGFLGEWGIETRYYKENGSAHSYRYMVQDTEQSLTSDGYTIYGQAVTEGRAADFAKGLSRTTIFKNATALRAANGYESNGDGSYSKGNRTYYSVFEASESAVSWANGRAVSDDTATLFAVTEQKNADQGSSYVAVCASADFGTEEFLQSSVYGNTDTLMIFFGSIGKKNLPIGLTLKPFEATDISTVTTAQMWRWTVALAAIPAVAVTAVALIVLVKRRRA